MMQLVSMSSPGDIVHGGWARSSALQPSPSSNCCTTASCTSAFKPRFGNNRMNVFHLCNFSITPGSPPPTGEAIEPDV